MHHFPDPSRNFFLYLFSVWSGRVISINRNKDSRKLTAGEHRRQLSEVCEISRMILSYMQRCLSTCTFIWANIFERYIKTLWIIVTAKITKRNSKLERSHLSHMFYLCAKCVPAVSDLWIHNLRPSRAIRTKRYPAWCCENILNKILRCTPSVPKYLHLLTS
jgi:hypothetical protein